MSKILTQNSAIAQERINMQNTQIQQYSRKRGIPLFQENPFVDPVEIPIGKRHVTVAGGQHVTKDGESITHSGIHVVKEVDSEEFVKIYTRNMKAIFDLTRSELRIVQYLLSELQKTPNADQVHLHWFSAEKFFSEQDINMHRTTFQRSLIALLEKSFIAESTHPGAYWINPFLFFNGDRMRYIYEYRKQTKESLQNNSHSNDTESNEN